MEIQNLTPQYLDQTLNLIKEAIMLNFTFINFDGKEPIRDREILRTQNRARDYLKDRDHSKSNIKIIIEGDKVVGTMGYDLPSEVIIKEVGNDYVELMNAYVLPSEQGKGYGTLLLNEVLKEIGNQKVALYSGYKNAVKFWNKHFGEPYKFLPKYFDDNADCYIWTLE
jgi:GNAT superfamily N-acetyltransferase